MVQEHPRRKGRIGVEHCDPTITGIQRVVYQGLSDRVGESIVFASRVHLVNYPNHIEGDSFAEESDHNDNHNDTQQQGLGTLISKLEQVFGNTYFNDSDGPKELNTENKTKTTQKQSNCVYFCVSHSSIYFVDINSLQSNSLIGSSTRCLHFSDLEGVSYASSPPSQPSDDTQPLLLLQVSGKPSPLSSLGSPLDLNPTTYDILIWTRQPSLVLSHLQSNYQAYSTLLNRSITSVPISGIPPTRPYTGTFFAEDPSSCYTPSDSAFYRWMYRCGYWFYAPSHFTDVYGSYPERAFTTLVGHSHTNIGHRNSNSNSKNNSDTNTKNTIKYKSSQVDKPSSSSSAEEKAIDTGTGTGTGAIGKSSGYGEDWDGSNYDKRVHLVIRVCSTEYTQHTSVGGFRMSVGSVAHDAARWEACAVSSQGEEAAGGGEGDHVPYLKVQDQYFPDDESWNLFRKEFPVGARPRRMYSHAEDTSRWTRHLVTLVTRKRVICVLGIRREFSPPFLNGVQDAYLVLYDVRREFVDTEQATRRQIRETQRHLYELGDTWQPNEYFGSAPPNTDIPAHDPLVLRGMLNSLSCSMDAYLWLATKLDMHPSLEFVGVPCHSLSFAFCGTLLLQMEPLLLKEGSGDSNIALILQLGFVSDPLAIVHRLEAEMAASTSTSTSTSTCSSSSTNSVSSAALCQWKRAISRYFAYCTDKGMQLLLPPIENEKDGGKGVLLSITSLCVKATSNTVCEEVLDYLLYISFGEEGFIPSIGLFGRIQRMALLVEGNYIRDAVYINNKVLVSVLSSLVNGGQLNVLEYVIGRGLTQPKARNELMASFYLSVLVYTTSSMDKGNGNPELACAVLDRLKQSRQTLSRKLVPKLVSLVKYASLFLQESASQVLVFYLRSSPDLLSAQQKQGLFSLALLRLKASPSPTLLQVSLRLITHLLPFVSKSDKSEISDISDISDNPKITEITESFEKDSSPNFFNVSSIMLPLLSILSTTFFDQSHDLHTIREVSILTTALTKDDSLPCRHARRLFLKHNLHLHLLAFLTSSRLYLPIASELSAALGCLLYRVDSSDLHLKSHPALVSAIPSLLKLATLTHDPKNRKRALQILRLLRNMSFRCATVLLKMRDLGIDTILGQIETRFERALALSLEKGKGVGESDVTCKELGLVRMLKNRVQQPVAVNLVCMFDSSDDFSGVRGGSVRTASPLWLHKALLDTAFGVSLLKQMKEQVNGLFGQMGIVLNVGFVVYKMVPSSGSGQCIKGEKALGGVEEGLGFLKMDAKAWKRTRKASANNNTGGRKSGVCVALNRAVDLVNGNLVNGKKVKGLNFLLLFHGHDPNFLDTVHPFSAEGLDREGLSASFEQIFYTGHVSDSSSSEVLACLKESVGSERVVECGGLDIGDRSAKREIREQVKGVLGEVTHRIKGHAAAWMGIGPGDGM